MCAYAQSGLILATLGTVTHQAPPVCGLFQARILEGVAFPIPGDLPNPGIEPSSLMSPILAGKFFTTSPTWEVLTWHDHENHVPTKGRKGLFSI